jgi:hypothetical protein
LCFLYRLSSLNLDYLIHNHQYQGRISDQRTYTEELCSPNITTPRPKVSQALFTLVFMRLTCQVKPVKMFVSADFQYDHALPYDNTVNEQVPQYGYLSSMGYDKSFPDDPVQERNTAVAITASHHGMSSSTSRGEEEIESSQDSSIVHSP